MNTSTAVLERATQRDGRPNANDLVTALQAVEKSPKTAYTFNNLIGTWRLCFITGTKKTRQKAGVALGAGRYLPKIINIQLTYQTVDDHGSVENSVALGALKLALTGPVKFWPKTRCLAFDFTQMHITLGRLTLYRGRIKPEVAEQDFYQQPLKEQAFFKYFWVTNQGIAARGRGGGLALWYRD